MQCVRVSPAPAAVEPAPFETLAGRSRDVEMPRASGSFGGAPNAVRRLRESPRKGAPNMPQCV
jgi:hypothetical protein